MAEQSAKRQGGRAIRKAALEDVADIMQVMAAAKTIMRQSGNLHQWGEGYPSAEVIGADIRKEGGYVVTDEGRVVGYFALLPSPEPTNAKIYKGAWIEVTPRS